MNRYFHEEKLMAAANEDPEDSEIDKLVLPQFYTTLIFLVSAEFLAALVAIWEVFSGKKVAGDI